MKKFTYTILALALLITSCSKDNEPVPPGVENPEKGGIAIVTNIQNPAREFAENIKTRAEENIPLYLSISPKNEGGTSVNGKLSDYENGVVKNLEPGNYSVILNSKETTTFTPAFDDPWFYSVTESVAVEKGKNTNIGITVEMNNSGVCFEYDESLDRIFDDLTPAVTQDGTTLTYEFSKKKEIGYFNSGAVTFSFSDNGKEVEFGGEATRELKKNEILQVTLGYDPANGGLNLTYKVYTIDKNTKNLILDIDPDRPDQWLLGYVQIEILETDYANAVVSYKPFDGYVIEEARCAFVGGPSFDSEWGWGRTLDEMESWIRPSPLTTEPYPGNTTCGIDSLNTYINGYEHELLDAEPGYSVYAVMKAKVNGEWKWSVRKFRTKDWPETEVKSAWYFIPYYDKLTDTQPVRRAKEAVRYTGFDNIYTVDNIFTLNLFTREAVYLMAEYNSAKKELKLTGNEWKNGAPIINTISPMRALLDEDENLWSYGIFAYEKGTRNTTDLILKLDDNGYVIGCDCDLALELFYFNSHTHLGTYEVVPAGTPWEYAHPASNEWLGYIDTWPVFDPSPASVADHGIKILSGDERPKLKRMPQ